MSRASDASPGTAYLVTHYYPPESNPPANRLSNLAAVLAETFGKERVQVITGMPNHPDGKIKPGYRFRLWKKEKGAAGEPVLRVPEFPAPNRGFWRKSVGFISFGTSVFFTLLCKRLGPNDVVYVTSPPSLASYAIWLLKRLGKRNLRYVFEMRDPMPEIVAAMGFMNESGRTYRLLKKLSDLTIRDADHIVAVAEGMRDDAALICGRENCSLIYNPVDTRWFAPVPADDAAEFRDLHRELYGPDGTRVFAFAGSHSIYMGLGEVLKAFAALKDDTAPWRLLLIGYGEDTDRLKREVRDLQLQDRVFFPGYLKRDELRLWLCAADVLLSTRLDHPVYRRLIPTKMIEYMALGKWALVAHNCEFAQRVENVGFCRDVPLADERAFSDALAQCIRAPAPAPVDAMSFLEEGFTLDAFAGRQRSLFQKLLNETGCDDPFPSTRQ